MSDFWRQRVFTGEHCNDRNTPTAQRYADNGSQEAFRELVSRYASLVYSTSLRLVNGDTYLAQDIAQTVFIDLAGAAQNLSQRVMLGGWLHRHTCFIAGKALRSQRRRQAREEHALQMNALDADEGGSAWGEIAPLVDAAIDRLGTSDRTAIMLRFFEQHDLRAVGAALGVTEDAAQKRVARALEKLRSLLARQGFTLSTTALATGLTADAVSAIPMSLAGSISAAALAGASVGGGTTVTLLKLLTMTKLKISIVTALVVAGIATPVAFLNKAQKENELLQRENQQLAELRIEHDRLAAQVGQAEEVKSLTDAQRSELMRLRGEVGLLRRESQELAKLRMEGRGKGADDQPNQFMAADSWANVGTATPEAALQTFLWAAKHKDTNLVENLIRWKKHDSVPEFDGLGEIMRSLIPASARWVSGLDGIRVVAQQADDAQTTRVRVEFASTEGKAETKELQFVQVQDDWMPLFHVFSPRQGSIQSALEVPPTLGIEAQ